MEIAKFFFFAGVVWLGSAEQISVFSQTERFLSLFSVVRFKNSMCVGSGGLFGTCYTHSQCKSNGGNPSGTCAEGFGTCCVTQLGCGGSTSNNCTYIESPNYPATFNRALTCKQTIQLNAEACQVRLDVTEVNLTPPDTRGNCNNDVLRFSQDIKWTQVCGLTQDSHFYLDVDPSAISTLDFTFTTDDTSYNRRWRIKVSQICCDQISMAPTGCGQYFTSVSGTIRGWNSQGNPDVYLSGQNYAICLRKEIDRCSTTYLDLNPTGNIFFPICDDTLEWPFPILTGTNTFPCVSINTVFPQIPVTVPLQGPNYLYLVTGDTTNSHINAGVSAGNINMQYTQNAC